MQKQQWSLHEIANELELELRGDRQHNISGIATLSDAKPDQIAFLANPSYRKQLATTQAGAIILSAFDKHTTLCQLCSYC